MEADWLEEREGGEVLVRGMETATDPPPPAPEAPAGSQAPCWGLLVHFPPPPGPRAPKRSCFRDEEREAGSATVTAEGASGPEFGLPEALPRAGGGGERSAQAPAHSRDKL